MAELLRETFEAYAERAPDAAGLRDAVAARVRRDRVRRRWTVAATAAAAAAAVVAVVAVTAPGGGPLPPAAPDGRYTEPPAPPGTRWLLWRGVEVAVPEAWLEGEFDACGEPTTDAVLVNDVPGDQCASAPPPTLSVLVMTTAESSLLDGIRDWRDLTVSGSPARRGAGTAYIDRAYALVIPGNDAALVVATPDRAVADRVFGTVRVRAGVDSRGCAIRSGSLEPRPPVRPGAEARLVPDGAVQASVCVYGAGFVAVSKLLDAERAAALAAALNAPQGGAAQYRRGRPVAMTFRYPAGPDVVVYLGADDQVTNGAVTGTAGPPTADALRPIVGWRATYEQERLG